MKNIYLLYEHFPKKIFALFLLISFIYLNFRAASASDSQWINTGSLNTYHRVHTATLLPDGKVLVAGGCSDIGCASTTASAELYDPTTDTWTSTASMNYARVEHSAILLPNGKVLIAGGHVGSTILNSVELYDPTMGTWTIIDPMISGRYSFYPVLLQNGKILVAGGVGEGYNFISNSELFDPITGSWTSTGSLNITRAGGSTILLENGKVLIAGGQNNTFLTSAELYDADSGTWTYTGSMNQNHSYQPLIQLLNGKVLFIGAPSNPNCELYDPAAGTWAYTGSMNVVRRGASVALLPNGEVLAAGGSISGGPGLTASAEIYNPFTGIWTNIDPMNSAKVWVPATLLQNGNVLIAMGTSAEIYYQNYAPTADAGFDHSVFTLSLVTLDGSGSSDPNGDPLTFQWTQTSGTFVTLSEPNAVNPTFTSPGDPDTLIFSLVVTDSHGMVSEADEVVIFVNNQAPVAEAGGPYLVSTDSTIDLDGTGTDPDIDPLSYFWTATDGSFDDPSLEDPAYTAASQAGIYELTLTVTDPGGLSAEDTTLVVIYDPDAGFVTGGGWFNSPEGAYVPDPTLTGKATFGFVSKYKKGQSVPTGFTEFQFKMADLNFHSDTFQWLVIAGPKAMFKGTGTINGTGNYGFMITVIDEVLTPSTDVDLFRIKIWDKYNGDAIVYDNQFGDPEEADPSTTIGGGNIKIHKGD